VRTVVADRWVRSPSLQPSEEGTPVVVVDRNPPDPRSHRLGRRCASQDEEGPPHLPHVPQHFSLTPRARAIRFEVVRHVRYVRWLAIQPHSDPRPGPPGPPLIQAGHQLTEPGHELVEAGVLSDERLVTAAQYLTDPDSTGYSITLKVLNL
jgi:hypothetical protein